MNIDPFSSPPQRRTTTGEPDDVRISKADILNMISNTLFDDIYIRRDLMSDDEATTVSFLKAIGQSLAAILIQNLPQKSSPKSFSHLL
jgi:hypothetical protein